MEVINDLRDCTPIPNGVVSVGTFDGIHLGHQKIIQRVIEHAKDLTPHSARATIVTFEPHPRLVVKQRDGQQVWILTTTEEKITIFRESGINRVVIIPFTKEFSQTSPETFISDILCGTIGLQKLIIGHDHGFGRNRAGNIDFLLQLEKKCNFEVINQEPISNQWGIISSSRIRKFVLRGEINKVSECLGRPYRLTGIVVPGDGIGHKLNYPTANVQVSHPNKCIPADGVYIVLVGINGAQYNGVMNIGTKPTFGKNTRSLEVNILDFTGDIYNTQIDIYFFERIRGEKKFDSPDLLRKQMNADVDFTRNYFLHHPEYSG